jgi:TonB family protein
MTLQPRLLNGPEVERAIAKNYPPLLRDAGIGGRTKVWFLIDETGRSLKWQVNSRSGYDALDAAALRIAPVLRFTPAQNQGKNVPVWVSIDIVFRIDGNPSADSLARLQRSGGATTRQRADIPTVGGVSVNGDRTPRASTGTATITGLVSNGNPLPYVQVHLQGTNLATLTDQAGRYVLQGVAPGTVKLSYSGPGYETATLQATAVANSTTTVNAFLNAKAIEMSSLTSRKADPRAPNVAVGRDVTITDTVAWVDGVPIRRLDPGSTKADFELPDNARQPVFTPMTLQPKLLNAAEIEAVIEKVYPPLLKDAGIGGRTKVWFYIDETGRATKWQVNTPSGYDALDAAAMKVAPLLRFTPAQNQDRKVPVWVSIDIVFKP